MVVNVSVHTTNDRLHVLLITYKQGIIIMYSYNDNNIYSNFTKYRKGQHFLFITQSVSVRTCRYQLYLYYIITVQTCGFAKSVTNDTFNIIFHNISFVVYHVKSGNTPVFCNYLISWFYRKFAKGQLNQNSLNVCFAKMSLRWPRATALTCDPWVGDKDWDEYLHDFQTPCVMFDEAVHHTLGMACYRGCQLYSSQ